MGILSCKMADSVVDAPFMSGLDLSECFYHEIVKPLLGEFDASLIHSAALIGKGSEVIGCDTAMSMDHDWGPRMILFLRDTDLIQYKDSLNAFLSCRLPQKFRGFFTNFSNPDTIGVRLMEPAAEGQPIFHNIKITSINEYFKEYLGVEVSKYPENTLPVTVWLTLPEQKLLTLVMGRIFVDHTDICLQEALSRFSYYPRDVWLYLMLTCWNRIEGEGHLVGRSGIVGDEIGSAIIASRVVRDVMRLCFLLEKKYSPYPKWFGTHFARLECSKGLIPLMDRVLFNSSTWDIRQEHLNPVLEHVANLQAATLLQCLISMGEYTEALRSLIVDPDVLQVISSVQTIGNIDMISDNVDGLCDVRLREKLEELFK